MEWHGRIQNIKEIVNASEKSMKKEVADVKREVADVNNKVDDVKREVAEMKEQLQTIINKLS